MAADWNLIKRVWVSLHSHRHQPLEDDLALLASPPACTQSRLEAITSSLGSIEVVTAATADLPAVMKYRIGAESSEGIEHLASLLERSNVQRDIPIQDERIKRGERFLALSRQMLKSGHFGIRSPFDGRALTTHRSFVFADNPYGSPLYAYFFDDRLPFYVLVNGYISCSISGIYFPLDNILFAVGLNAKDAARLASSLEGFRCLLLGDPRTTAKRLQFDDKTALRPALLMRTSHFAHNLWNEMSAIEGLVEQAPAELELHVNFEPNGPIKEIFPALPPDRIVNHGGTSSDEFYAKLNRQSAFFVPLGRMFIPKSLTERIYETSKRLHVLDWQLAQNVRSSHNLVLWISIRTELRVWQDQAAGIAQLIDRVASEVGSLAVIFDGYTPGYNLASDRQLIAKEEAVVDQIIASVRSNFTSVSLIGASVTQAYVWGGAADAYFVNHGTIQHKIGWMHDLPGITHTFRSATFDPSSFTALYAREEALVPSYLYGDKARDNNRSTDPRSDLYDYKISGEDLSWAAQYLASNSRRGVSAPIRGKPLQRVSGEHKLKQKSDELRSEASRRWGQGDWTGTLQNFSEAVAISPYYQDAFKSLIGFLLSTYYSRFKAHEQSDIAFLLLKLCSLLGTNRSWANAELINLLLAQDNDFLTPEWCLPPAIAEALLVALNHEIENSRDDTERVAQLHGLVQKLSVQHPSV